MPMPPQKKITGIQGFNGNGSGKKTSRFSFRRVLVRTKPANPKLRLPIGWFTWEAASVKSAQV